MSAEKTAEQFIELLQRYMRLRPKLIQPEYVVQFKKKMAAFRNSSHSEDHEFVFRILMLLSQNTDPLTMSELSSELNETGIAYNKQRIAKLLKNFTAEEQSQLLNLMNKLFDALLNEE